ncbi:MAG: nitrilase-related carbon-nitrogen hydrolase, partial [Opitutales bacterium]
VARAAAAGAQVILPPELFESHYFCKTEKAGPFRDAFPTAEHPAVQAMQAAAKAHGVVIPTSFFERDGPHFYNSLAMIDADGALLGVYRKSHLPDGPGYEEKFYFRPGNTGFRVWETGYGKLGVGICWDQWFPECARAMVLQGADVLFYPTAIGSEPEEPDFDTAAPWQRAMQGHAVCNVVPVVAANRVGDEDGQIFYGSSFICDHRGEKLASADRASPAILSATLDLERVREDRATMGFFRDRRPDLYGELTRP